MGRGPRHQVHYKRDADCARPDAGSSSDESQQVRPSLWECPLPEIGGVVELLQQSF